MKLTIDGCIKIDKQGSRTAYALFGAELTIWQHSEDSILKPIVSSIITLDADDTRQPIDIARSLSEQATAQGFVVTPETLAQPAIHRAYDALAAEYDPFSLNGTTMNAIAAAMRELRKLMPEPKAEQGGTDDE